MNLEFDLRDSLSVSYVAVYTGQIEQVTSQINLNHLVYIIFIQLIAETLVITTVQPNCIDVSFRLDCKR